MYEQRQNHYLLKDSCGTHARANAHGDHTKTGRLAPLLHLVQKRGSTPGTRAPQGVTQCNGSTVHIDLLRVQAQLLPTEGGLHTDKAFSGFLLRIVGEGEKFLHSDLSNACVEPSSCFGLQSCFTWPPH